MWNSTSTVPKWGAIRVNVIHLLNILKKLEADGKIRPSDRVIFDVKAIESCQDIAELQDFYTDKLDDDFSELVLVLH